MGDHSHIHTTLDWTLGKVEVRRFDMDEQRCLLLAAPDYDMHEYGGEIQAVCLQELDELILTLLEQRHFMGGDEQPKLKVYVPQWCAYVSDCPADLEVTDDEILGVFVTEAKANEACQAYMDRRVDEALTEGDLTGSGAGLMRQSRASFESRFDGHFHMDIEALS